MSKAYRKIREEARRLFLTGEVATNVEIATHLGVKPHTIGIWRRQEDWDGLRRKIDLRAAEKLVEKIATERVTLNLRHFRIWELILAKMAEVLKDAGKLDIRILDKATGIMDRAQKGQRVAKGLSATGETEEAIRAQAESDIRQLIDVFVDSIKEHVKDEESREKIRKAVLEGVFPEPDGGAGDGQDPSLH